MAEKFYITTTIPYANAPPHIGFALEIVQADVLARWSKLKGKKVFFLTGTDEHGSKIYKTAKSQKLNPQKFVDRNSDFFKKLAEVLNISNNDFIRTTDRKRHWPGVVEIWKALEAKGDLYKKKYVGKYCSGCERYVTEKDLVGGKCVNHPNIEIEELSEENYFFRLSKYSDKIKKLIKSDKLKIFPKQWKNEFLGLVEGGLQDVSFSRDTKYLPWGIPVPGDKNQVMYVWCDALPNYLTGIGYPDKRFKKYWPADVHVAGKDMLRFHAGIWPGMLLSAGLELPKEIIVHGFLTVNGKKISKSLGNVVSPLELLQKYSADTFRYFLCRNFVFGQDGDFSEKELIARHNNELADKLGNLVSRVSALIEKNGIEKTAPKGVYPRRAREPLTRHQGGASSSSSPSVKGDVNTEGKNKLLKKLNEAKIEKLFGDYKFDKILNEIFRFIDVCNEYVQNKKPWETQDKKVLYELADSIKVIGILLWPFIPLTSEKIAKQFGFKIDFNEVKKPLRIKKIRKEEILFRKIKG